jgi:hypothetical protein
VDELRESSRPEQAPEGFDLVSEKKERKSRGKKRVSADNFGDEAYGEKKARKN